SRIRVNIGQESFIGEKTSKTDSVVKLIFGGLAGYLLFMFIIIYGNMIMRSVIEEKTSRIIEIIISSVKPIQLMLGKIIGTSLAGITQFVIWIILGGVLMTVLSMVFGIDFAQSQTNQQEMLNQAMQNTDVNTEIQNVITAFDNLPITNLIIAFILFFIGGYLLYSSLYAAIGAAVDNETDTQQFLLPILMPLILAVYIGIFTVIEDPHGTVSTVFSFIPFTSPVVMLMRIPFGVPIWQQLVSLALLIGTFILTVWFTAKIYRVRILMYGKKPSYKELLKWIKYESNMQNHLEEIENIVTESGAWETYLEFLRTVLYVNEDKTIKMTIGLVLLVFVIYIITTIVLNFVRRIYSKRLPKADKAKFNTVFP